MEYIVHN